MTNRSLRLLLLTPLLAIAFAAAGCSDGYHLRGRVIQGEASYVAVVDPSDPRLTQPGLDGVALHLQMEPGKANRETITRDLSGPGGEFALKVDRFGAGWMEYDVGLFARLPGFNPAQHFFRLPPDSKRVLIMMAPGRDRDLGEERDLSLDDYARFR